MGKKSWAPAFNFVGSFYFRLFIGLPPVVKSKDVRWFALEKVQGWNFVLERKSHPRTLWG
jgi:hypothetical protein